jgi:hydroxymethylbilane synthase
MAAGGRAGGDRALRACRRRPDGAILARVNDRAASTALAAERAFLAVLDGSCRTPIGGHARIEGDRLALRGVIIKPDGSDAHEVVRRGPPADAVRIGTDAGRELAARGGAGFFAVA